MATSEESLQVAKFDGRNFGSWRIQMETLLRRNEVWEVINPGYEESKYKGGWVECDDNSWKNFMARMYMQENMEKSVFEKIEFERNSKKAWEILLNCYDNAMDVKVGEEKKQSIHEGDASRVGFLMQETVDEYGKKCSLGVDSGQLICDKDASAFVVIKDDGEESPYEICSSHTKLPKISDTLLRSPASSSVKRNAALRSEASKETLSLTKDINNNKMSVAENDQATDIFGEMKNRFLSFKKLKYLNNLDHYQNLAESQSPKFLVVACADSRVCPSSVLGFQPGDAFVVRNVANLVPPFENGPTETNAALEFAVNALEVENILIIGHSRCGGIRALMSMEDEALIRVQNEGDSSFIRNWVVVGKNARSSAKAAAGNLSLDLQCKHCEKESVNNSLRNLLTYPWIEERVSKGLLSIHGGYYDFVNCSFEKWTLSYKGRSKEKEGHNVSIGQRQFWS